MERRDYFKNHLYQNEFHEHFDDLCTFQFGAGELINPDNLALFYCSKYVPSANKKKKIPSKLTNEITEFNIIALIKLMQNATPCDFFKIQYLSKAIMIPRNKTTIKIYIAYDLYASLYSKEQTILSNN